MRSIKLVGNYISEFDTPTNPNRGQGQLQLVLHDRNSLSKEIELARPDPNSFPALWQFNEQLHGGPTPYIEWNDAVQNPNRYKQLELDLRPGTTADGTWQLFGQITASLADQGFAISYDARNQNENSYVTSVLSVVGIDIEALGLERYKPVDVTGYSGIETNIFESGAQPLFSGERVMINLDLAGTNYTDYIQGGSGDDILRGAFLGDDTIKGGAGSDMIYGSWHANLLEGGTGADTIDGSWGNDTIHGDDGNDQLLGGWGNDRILGGAGNDYLSGGRGDDVVSGNAGDDMIYGDEGNDQIFGGSGYDSILDGAGSDTIYAGTGADVMYDGQGNDVYYGNDGADTFVFRSASLERWSRDEVRDFESGTDTLIFANIKSYTGHSISSGQDADTNGDGKISALDKGWFNSGSDSLVFYAEDFAAIRITVTNGMQELQIDDFL